MEDFTIDARQVRAAMIFQANQDVRYYLNGILLGNKRAIATNGHTLISMESPEADFKPMLFTVKGKIPKSAVSCQFVFIDDESGVIFFTNGRGVETNDCRRFSCQEVPQYPDVDRVIPTGDPDAPNEVAFNTTYMTYVNSAAVALGASIPAARFKFYDSKMAVTIQTPETTATCVIMGVRL